MFVVYESVSWCLMGGLSPCGWGGIVKGQTLAVVFPLPVIHARLSVVGSPLLFILLSGVGTLSCVIVSSTKWPNLRAYWPVCTIV